MAMNKAERAAFEAMRERAALAWPTYAKPGPVTWKHLQGGSEWARGWWMNPNSGRVGEGVTNGSLHAREPYTNEQLAGRYASGTRSISLSQTSGGPWYATRLDALRALHWAIAQHSARELANIEREIEAEPA